MCKANISPAKLVRSVRRMANLNESKSFKTILSKENIQPLRKILSFANQDSIDIPPKQKILALSKMPSFSIPPERLPPQLSYVNVCCTDLPPDPLPCFYCNLICPKPNLPPTPTRPIEMCSVCWKPLREDVEHMYCCESAMHNLCWGDHDCCRN